MPDKFKYYKGEKFLLLEEVTRDNKIIHMYGNSRGIELLNTNNLWAMDGTHKICPKPFCQIYVIGAVVNCHFLPALYCLLPSHSADDYNVLFEYIKN